MRVPIIDRSVSTNPVSGQRLTAQPNAGDFGAGVGQAISGPVASVLADERRKAQELALQAADIQLAELETRLLHDAETGALHKQGRHALEMGEQPLTDFDKAAGEIGARMTGPARDAFERIRVGRRNGIDRALQQHLAGETKRFRRETTEALLTAEMRSVQLWPDDPDRLMEATTRAYHAVTALHEAEGLPPEALEETRRQSDSRIHIAAIGALVQRGDIARAKAMVENQGRHYLMTAEDRAKGAAMIKVADMRQRSLAASDRILAEHATLGERIKAVREIADLDLREEVDRRVRDGHAMQERVRREETEAAWEGFADPISKGEDIEALAQAAPEAWAMLDFRQRSALHTVASQYARGKIPEPGGELFFEALELASSQVPAERARFLALDPARMRPHLAPSEYVELRRLQVKMRTEPDKLSGEDKGLISRGEAVGTFLRMAGLDPKEERENPVLLRRLDAMVRDAQAEKGREFRPDELRTLFEPLLAEVVTGRRSLWNPTALWRGREIAAPIWQAALESGDALTISDVPTDFIRQRQAQMRAAGRPALSNDELMEAYNESLP